ncbi:MAG: cupin domain-containing protein, partial [Clostridia bacterium]|nr:cupin domain-containing protein [Clostridia bacterium]
MNNFKKASVADGARSELHEALGLTGAEISVNTLPAGASVPFVHSHKQNEEIYAILEGEGTAV